MNRFVIALLAGAGIAATAQAGMSYDMPVAYVGHGVDASEGSHTFSSYPISFQDNTGFAAMSSPTPFDLVSTINPGEFTNINSAQTRTTGVAQQSSSRFEVTWSHTSHASANPGTSARVASDLFVYLTGQVAFDSDATVRMYFNAQSPYFGNVLGAPNTELTVNPNANSPIGAFSYLSGHPGNVSVPFDIQFPVSAGNVLDFNLAVSASVDTSYAGFASGWDRSSSGSIIIEIIPAPSAAGLLALGGFAATRRRRQA